MLIDGSFLVPLQSWLETHFPAARLLVVGGSVRDALRGHPSKDLDLEIVGATPEQIAEALPWPKQQVGKSYGLLLVQLGEQGWLELSVEPGSFQDWETLCQRRDFTCNTIAWDVVEQKLIDPLGGQRDIECGCLRQASPTSIQADPLRIWRAAQFCARFDWEVDAQLVGAIKRSVPLLEGLAQERITREWEKLLTLPPRPARALQLLDDWGVILDYYPELFALHECPQEAAFHPEGDVWIHTLMVLDQAASLGRERQLAPEQRLQLGLAALLHDLGKPSTTRRESGRITAHGHELAGLKPARQWFERHRFGEPTALAVLDCVGKHMRPMQLTREILAGKLSPAQQFNAVRRLIRDLEAVDWEVFLTLCEADQRGRALPQEDYLPRQVFEKILHEYPNLLQTARTDLLRGRDLIALGIQPGRQMGDWLDRVERARDAGEVATPEEAREWVRQRLAEAR